MDEKEKEQEIIVGNVVFCKCQLANGFTVIIVEDEKGDKRIVQGNNLPVDKGFPFRFYGKTINHKKYGESLKCSFFEIIPPDDEEQIIKFMVCFIAGIGPATAKKIYKYYDKNSLEVLKDFEKINQICSQKTAEKIYKSACTVLGDKELYFLLMNFKISSKLVPEISNNLGSDAVEKIKENPFILQEFKVPFVKMNRMAVDFKSQLDSEQRIKLAIEYYLKVINAQQGDCYAEFGIEETKNNFVFGKSVKDVEKFLNNGLDSKYFVNSKKIVKYFKEMTKSKDVHLEKTTTGHWYASDKFYYDAEEYISTRLLELAKDKPKFFSNAKINKTISDIENANNIKLADSQRLAVQTVLNNKITVITGSAGTGKTTVMKFCIESYIRLIGGSICLAAPTGRASRRMAEATLIGNASTVHSLLKITKDDDPNAVKTQSKIESSIIFIDEVSMIDTVLLYKILYNSSPETRFVFIGDPQQLPSVGAGNVLKDIIDSEVIPVVKLQVIYRQCQDSNIIGNANNIIHGRTEIKTGNDFVFIEKDKTLENKQAVVDTFLSELKNFDDLLEVQVITPMREKGELSALSINKAIQQIYNPQKTGELFISVNGVSLHRNDKIICQVNADKIKNGDIGIIKEIKFEDDILTAFVDFSDKIIELTKDDMQNLNITLAYAITVHKSQGSEFDSVIIPINSENRRMLQRNLLYTAVTRASKKMTIVGTKKDYADAIAKNRVRKRNTTLKRLLIKKS